jgi:chromosomal replication initiator protein
MVSSRKQPEQLTVQEIHSALQDFMNTSQDGIGHSWLNSITLELADSGQKLDVLFPHAFFAEWFKHSLQKQFESFLYSHFPALSAIRYQTNSRRLDGRILKSFVPNARYSFETFLYNKKNYLAYISAMQLTGTGRLASNPFLILGEGGTGKTHLSRAIANHLLTESPRLSLGLYTVDELNFLYRTRIKTDRALRNELYSFDVLVLEDIQQLELYPKLQEQLIYVCDTFLEDDRQMIYSSTESLSELDFIDPKLRSRLEGGLIVQLKRPDLDVRLEYVRQQSQQLGLNLKEDQILAVARHCQDFQSLYRTMVRLTARYQLQTKAPDQKEFTALLRQQEDRGDSAPDFHSITETVCAYFQVDRNALLSEKRTKELVLARQVGMYLCRSLLNESYSRIGASFGDKDHSTVIYSIKKIKQLQKDNHKTKTMLKELKNRCRHRGST